MASFAGGYRTGAPIQSAPFPPPHSVPPPDVSRNDAPHVPSFLERLVLGTLPFVPRPIMRRMASRYFAGEELADAIAELGRLHRAGHPGIIDLLGEHVEHEEEARRVLVEYRRAADAVAREHLDAYVSVKPTHFGLALSEELAFELYDTLAAHCTERGLFLRVEMEDSPTTDATLRLFARLRARHTNVGIVLQSRLHRTPADIRALPPGPVDVRLVKGIYLEPAKIAHVDAAAIRRAYFDCALALFERGAFLGLATHDDVLASELLEALATRRIGNERFEFQVLLGVREPLWETWRRAGHTVRVYVPYGPQWRAYSLRRMRKNPELLRAIARNTLRGARG